MIGRRRALQDSGRTSERLSPALVSVMPYFCTTEGLCILNPFAHILELKGY